MNINLVTTSFPCPENQNSGVFIHYLVQHLKRKCEVSVIYPCSKTSTSNISKQYFCFRYAPRKLQTLAHNPGGIPVALSNNKAPILVKNPYLYFILPFFLLSLFASVLKKSFNTDLIHANWTVVGFISGLAGLISHTPVITTIRGSDVNKINSSSISYFLFYISLKLNKKLIVVSKSLLQILQSKFPKDSHKIIHIENGINKKFFDLKIAQFTEDNIHIICVGNLIAGKDISTLIKATQEIDKIKLNIHIIGEGEEKIRLINLTKKNNSLHQYHFYGLQNHQQLQSILEKSHLFIIPSLSEGRSNALLEAMASGKAIIASNIPGNSELIKDNINGLLFEAGSTKQLKSCILQLINTPDKACKLSRNARKTIQEMQLYWENTADKYIETYKEVIK